MPEQAGLNFILDVILYEQNSIIKIGNDHDPSHRQTYDQGERRHDNTYCSNPCMTTGLQSTASSQFHKPGVICIGRIFKILQSPISPERASLVNVTCHLQETLKACYRPSWSVGNSPDDQLVFKKWGVVKRRGSRKSPQGLSDEKIRN